jgi:hypothetical protein
MSRGFSDTCRAGGLLCFDGKSKSVSEDLDSLLINPANRLSIEVTGAERDSNNQTHVIHMTCLACFAFGKGASFQSIEVLEDESC